MNEKQIFTPAVAGMQASAIREIFKMLDKKDIISLAAGIPAPELFPAKEWSEITKDILENNAKTALVYGVTEGYLPLRNLTKERAKSLGAFDEESDELIITSGAQQAIDLTAKVFLNEGDAVIAEDPSFIGSLNSFRSYGAELYGAEVEQDGMNIKQVEKILCEHKNVKFIYTIPTFQNPSGTTMSLQKRKALLELAEKYDVLILEDNPYGELRFKGDKMPTLKSMDKNGRVIYAGTYSKTLAPGIRVGFLSAAKKIVDRVVVVKQVNDVNTTVLSQMMVYEYIKRYDFDAHIEKCCEVYKKRCELMLSEMDKKFSKNITYTRPDGGIFILVTMPKTCDTKKMLEEAIENNVAFVPGNTFMLNLEKPSNLLRLNYSVTNEESIVKGIDLLSKIVNKYADM